MKKILLLLVSGLLIACMAGSAFAGGITVDGWSSTEPYVITVSPDGTEKDVPLLFSGMNAGIEHKVQVNCAASKAGVSIGGVLDLPDGSQASGTVNTASLPVTYIPSSTTYTCNLHVSANGPGSIQVTDLESGQVFNAAVVISTDVPEFPTVALPVAAVIGLVFIFGRKKEGL